MTTERPRCACCNKPLRYHTTSYWFNSSDGPKPKSRAEALILAPQTNLQCVSVGWWTPTTIDGEPGERHVIKLNLWNGEDYLGYPHYGPKPPFCGLGCAAKFGLASHKAGYRIKARA